MAAGHQLSVGGPAGQRHPDRVSAFIDNITLVSLRAYCDYFVDFDQRQAATAGRPSEHVGSVQYQNPEPGHSARIPERWQSAEGLAGQKHRPTPDRADRRSNPHPRRRCFRQAGNLSLHQVVGGHGAFVYLHFVRAGRDYQHVPPGDRNEGRPHHGCPGRRCNQRSGDYVSRHGCQGSRNP